MQYFPVSISAFERAERFYKTWLESYTPGGRPRNVLYNFLVINQSLADARTCDVGMKLASFSFRALKDARFEVISNQFDT